ncbi:MAG: pyridoxamine 5'-phosphate oxidase family protein [Proteobacteria bacterium]|nr:pyridoxamine 5'-phosphate oxidase family protein [Pseudomonadota bacterium]
MNIAEILNFLDAQQIYTLATLADGVPVMRALINIRHPEIAPHLVGFFKKDNRILMITNTHSDKIAQIRAHSAASLYAYTAGYDGMLLTGKVREVTESATKNALWDDSWKMYYPAGRDGGDFSVLEFIPETYKFYHEFSVDKGAVSA